MNLELGGCYWFCKKCGVRLGYLPFHDHEVTPPHWHKRFKDDSPYPYCQSCYDSFKVKHVGQGVFVRPKTGGDRVTLPKGPKLEELYS